MGVPTFFAWLAKKYSVVSVVTPRKVRLPPLPHRIAWLSAFILAFLAGGGQWPRARGKHRPHPAKLLRYGNTGDAGRIFLELGVWGAAVFSEGGIWVIFYIFLLVYQPRL